MPFVLNDGYTLTAATKPEYEKYKGLPVVTFTYRPATAVALADWRYAFRDAATGAAEVEAAAKLVAAHVTSWDVTEADGRQAPVTVANFTRLPAPIAEQIFGAVTTWAGPQQDAAAGN